MSVRRELENAIVASAVVDEMVAGSVCALRQTVSESRHCVESCEALDPWEMKGSELYGWFMAERRLAAAEGREEVGYATMVYVPAGDLPEAMRLISAQDQYLEKQEVLGNGFIDGFRRARLNRVAGMPLEQLAKLCRLEQLGDSSGLHALDAVGAYVSADPQRYDHPSIETLKFVQDWGDFLHDKHQLGQSGAVST